MNATEMAMRAYTPDVAATKTERAIEAQVLTSITNSLRNAKGDFPKLVTALDRNRQFWTLLAADVSSDENLLGPDLRAKILYLAEFTRRQTFSIISGDETVDVLIDINATIVEGLSSRGSATCLA